MNMVGHQFYMFQNMETDDINVVYLEKTEPTACWSLNWNKACKTL